MSTTTTTAALEIVLFDSDPFVRMSCTDLVEVNGKNFLTETQKNVARIHEISAELIEGMWAALAVQLDQVAPLAINDDQCLLSLPEAAEPMPSVAAMPVFRVRDWSARDCGVTESDLTPQRARPSPTNLRGSTSSMTQVTLQPAPLERCGKS